MPLLKSTGPIRNYSLLLPKYPSQDYPTDDIPLERVINVMVGDLQRIKIYPAKGFQIYQEIPDTIWQAYERLVELGFDKHLAR